MTDCLLIATGLREPAERAAAAAGLAARIVASKEDCADRLGELRAQARRLGLETVAVHSGDWSRQAMPQFFELAALRLGARELRILSGPGPQGTVLTRARLRRRLAALPFEAAAALAVTGAEAARLAGPAGRRRPPRRAAPGGELAILALWRGLTPETPAGGAVTHVSGILSGFRRLGARVGLVTPYPPPDAVAAVVDDVELVAPPPPAERLTREIEGACLNRLERRAAGALAARLRPSLVYARHDGFLTSPADVAAGLGVPVVLEWNSSAVWVRANWHAQRRLKTAFNPLLAAMERNALRRASVIAAVSRHAGSMAVEAGAPADRVIVVPNGVDLEAIDGYAAADGAAADGAAAGETPGAPSPPRLGWVGWLSQWHGAEVLIEAMPRLDPAVTVLMIGDGPRREACEALAGRLAVADRIEWTGSLPHAEAVRRLAGCDVLVSPHVPFPDGRPFFGSPTKIFEYMALGKPIVASSLEQIGELLEDGRTARLVTPGDAGELAGAIGDVLAMPDRGRALGEAARRTAEAEHRWEQRARAILDPLGLTAPAAATVGAGR